MEEGFDPYEIGVYERAIPFFDDSQTIADVGLDAESRVSNALASNAHLPVRNLNHSHLVHHEEADHGSLDWLVVFLFAISALRVEFSKTR